MIGMNIPKGLTELAVRAVEALERIADAAEAIDRGMTMDRLGAASREEVELFGGPLDGQRHVVPRTLGAVTVAQFTGWDPEENERVAGMPVLEHRYVRSDEPGRFDYTGGWVRPT